jgi:hypothetical protein
VIGTVPPPLLPPAPPLAKLAPAAGPTAQPPLSAEHLQQLEAARKLGRKIAKAVSVALFDGWAVATFATLTFLLGLMSVPGMLMGAGMGVVAWLELRGARGLRRLDPAAARLLGYNQVGLGSILIVYALWGIIRELTGAGEYAEMAAADPQLADMLKPVENITRMLSLGVNFGLIAVALIAQGSLAAYYFTRIKYIRAYVTQTPPWIVAVQKTGSLI